MNIKIKKASNRKWYKQYVGFIINVTYNEEDNVYDINNAKDLFPLEFDDGVVGLYIEADDVEFLGDKN